MKVSTTYCLVGFELSVFRRKLKISWIQRIRIDEILRHTHMDMQVLTYLKHVSTEPHSDLNIVIPTTLSHGNMEPTI